MLVDHEDAIERAKAAYADLRSREVGWPIISDSRWRAVDSENYTIVIGYDKKVSYADGRHAVAVRYRADWKPSIISPRGYRMVQVI